MADHRIAIPAVLRNLGIIGGVIAIVLGLMMAWRESGHEPYLHATGYVLPAKPKNRFVSAIERILSELLKHYFGFDPFEDQK